MDITLAAFTKKESHDLAKIQEAALSRGRGISQLLERHNLTYFFSWQHTQDRALAFF